MLTDRALAPGSWLVLTAAKLLACSLASVMLTGCGSAKLDASEHDGNGDGTGSSDSYTAGPTELVFEQPSPLTMRPGESRELSVRAAPAAAYAVRFALVGESHNASLNRSEAVTDASGQAFVGLTAPTGAVTTFTVRASAGTAVSAEVIVSVSDGGFAALEVQPSYPGTRPVSSWIASVRPGTDCESLGTLPAPDADLWAASEGADDVPIIEAVPVGGMLAVTLRAEYFAGGCTELSGLAAAERTQVVVSVTDVPLQLQETELEVVLDVQDVVPSWEEVVDPLVAQATEALLGDSDDDVDALLDAMQEHGTDAQQRDALAEARQAAGWDGLVREAWGAADASTAVRQLASGWLQAGASELGPDTIRGQLTAAGGASGRAVLVMESFGGVEARAAGFAASNLVSWTADPDDTVLLGANLLWLPSQWLAQRALGAATEQPGTVASVPAALAAELDCAGLSGAWLDAAETADLAFGGCDEACLAAVCEAAFSTLWSRVAQASASAPTALRISTVAAASVDEVARPRAFEGSWLGTLETEVVASLEGPASGGAPSPPE